MSVNRNARTDEANLPQATYPADGYKTVKMAVLAQRLQGNPTRAVRYHNFEVVADVAACAICSCVVVSVGKRLRCDGSTVHLALVNTGLRMRDTHGRDF